SGICTFSLPIAKKCAFDDCLYIASTIEKATSTAASNAKKLYFLWEHAFKTTMVSVLFSCSNSFVINSFFLAVCFQSIDENLSPGIYSLVPIAIFVFFNRKEWADCSP